MVLAGPGSGKTTVITHRVRCLIEEHGVNPSNILVITFTRSAAEEMKQRFWKLMETSSKQAEENMQGLKSMNVEAGGILPVNFGTFMLCFLTFFAMLIVMTPPALYGRRSGRRSSEK